MCTLDQEILKLQIKIKGMINTHLLLFIGMLFKLFFYFNFTYVDYTQLLWMSSNQWTVNILLHLSQTFLLTENATSRSPKLLRENHCLKIAGEGAKRGKNVSTFQKQEEFVFSSEKNSPEMLWNSAFEETPGFLLHGLLYFIWKDPNTLSGHIPWLSVLDMSFTQTQQTHQGMVEQQQLE